MNLAALAMVHRIAELPWPLATLDGKLTRHTVRRSPEVPERRQQKDPLSRDLAERIVAAMTHGGYDEVRDAALIFVACGKMCSRSDLIAFTLGNLIANPDGTSVLLMSKSKMDQEGDGSGRT